MMKTRVLQVFASLDMGGAECRMMDVYRSIDKDLFEFDFVTLTQGEQYFEKEIAELGGRVFKLHSPREIGIRNHIADLRQCIRNGNYNAVHAHTSYHCGLVMYAAYKEGIPVRIAHARTNDSIQSSLKTKAFIRFGRYLINRFSTNKIAISDVSGQFVFGNSDYTVVPNSINLSIYNGVPLSLVKQFRQDFDINDNSFVIGHIGRFDRFKNQRFVIDVFREFLNQNQNAQLVLVGDGDLKPELQQYVKESDIDNRVVFTGVRSDIPTVLNCFNVLLFPSIVEGLGGVVLEAQASGVPAVISGNVPDNVDVGLGLVNRCSLDEPIQHWIDLMNACSDKTKPKFAIIKDCFDKSGYSIESAIKKYSEIYRGNIS